MLENSEELALAFQKFKSAYVISKVLLNEVAELSAKINNTDFKLELEKLEQKIKEYQF